VTNLADTLLVHAGDTPASVALVDDSGSVTFGDLEERSARAAGELISQGVEAGDRIAIPGENTVPFVVSYLATLRVGAVAVPVNPQAPAAELERELATVDAKVVLREPLDGMRRGDAVPVVDRADNDVAVLLFTAGTAGAPKAAMLTHGSMRANIRQVLDHPGLGLHADDVGLAVLPFFHVFGLNAVLGLGLAAGSRSVLMDRFDAAQALALVREHGITVVAGVPAMYHEFLELDEGDAPKSTFGSVRLAISGAAPLPAEVFEAMRERFGVEVSDGYGLTEASPVVTTSAIGTGSLRPGHIGPPLPGVEVRLVDADGTDVLPGDPGEIWVRGPNVFLGYWDDDDATRRALTSDGWLRTGDIAVEDDAGELSLVDRAKDLIIVSGFNVYPAEVEEVLLDHPAVAEAAVVGEPDPRSGETIVAFVVAEPGTAPAPAELIEHCSRRLARYKCPARVEVVDELPRSFAGKVLRRQLRGASGPEL
jgi:long-chain acyl-CoA synthetase